MTISPPIEGLHAALIERGLMTLDALRYASYYALTPAGTLALPLLRQPRDIVLILIGV